VEQRGDGLDDLTGLRFSRRFGHLGGGRGNLALHEHRRESQTQQPAWFALPHLLDNRSRKQETQRSQNKHEAEKMISAEKTEQGTPALSLGQEREKGGRTAQIQKCTQGHKKGSQKRESPKICCAQGSRQKETGAKGKQPAHPTSEKTADQSGS
jgi:hypothetical protein